jgi:hypothetical protein
MPVVKVSFTRLFPVDPSRLIHFQPPPALLVGEITISHTVIFPTFNAIAGSLFRC